jgi:hypothetical protein
MLKPKYCNLSQLKISKIFPAKFIHFAFGKCSIETKLKENTNYY